MNIKGAVTFCSIQPCTRQAEGDLIIEQGGQEQRIAICPRHYEWFVNNPAHANTHDASREVVFVDDVGDDQMVNDIIRRGDPLEIIED